MNVFGPMKKGKEDHSPWFFGMETKPSSCILPVVGSFGRQGLCVSCGSSGWDVWEEPVTDPGNGHLL